MEEYDTFTKQLTKSAQMVKNSIVTSHLEVKKLKEAEDGKVAHEFLAEKRSRICTTIRALAAFQIVKYKRAITTCWQHKMEASLAGLSVHGIIAPIVLPLALIQGYREREG